MDKDCLDYLFKAFKNYGINEGLDIQEISDNWDRMPKSNKKYMVDLVMGYKPGTNSPLLNEIMAEYNKKTHSDTSFGMIVKSLIANHK